MALEHLNIHSPAEIEPSAGHTKIMKTQMIKRLFIHKFLSATTVMLILSAAMLSFASCVTEDLDDCPDIRLFIKTDHETGRYGEPNGTRAASRAENPDEWYNSIDSIDVYVFDENEKFVTLWKGGAYTPGVDYEVPLSYMGLPEGVYTFVAWSNSDEINDDTSGKHYYTNFDELMNALASGDPGEGGGSTSPQGELLLTDMRMDMKHPEGRLYDEESADLPHRHHGIERVYVSNSSILNGHHVLELFPSIHKVSFTVIGVPSDPTGSHTITVTDRNSAHDFRNNYIRGQEPHRVRRSLTPMVEEPQQATRADEEPPVLTASMYLMQLSDATTTRVEIHNPGDPDNPVYVVPDLNKMILNAHTGGTSVDEDTRPLDYNEKLEFTVSMDLKGYPDITFIINGWRYHYVHIDIGDNW